MYRPFSRTRTSNESDGIILQRNSSASTLLEIVVVHVNSDNLGRLNEGSIDWKSLDSYVS